ncbi:MAG: hypothetical protein A3G23_00300 [Bacteroidetes bacterium RIFCSPLOWO2_12_FULL_37_12]|nr:MAG: hypothetical protein A3G23_00300 [Bacteroidetes bacterium RIFCSPLOWO2_12_FULL_37_12]
MHTITFLPSISFKINFFAFAVVLLATSCTISDRQAIKKLENTFSTIQEEIHSKKSEQKLLTNSVYRYHKFLGKGFLPSPAMKKLLTPELMNYINVNYHSLFEKVEEVRIYPSAGARVFALDNEFNAEYVWEKLYTGKSSETFNRIIFLFLDFVFIYKDHLIILENDFANRELSPVQKKSVVNYEKPFKNYNPEKAEGEFSVSVTINGTGNEDFEKDTLEEKILKGYITSRQLIHKTRELISQDMTEQTLKSSKFLQINYTDFFKWGSDDKSLEIKRYPMIWVDNWLSDRATEIIKYLETETAFTDSEGMLDSSGILKEISSLYFPFAVLKNYGWIFGSTDRTKYYLFQSMAGKPQLNGLVRFTGSDTLFDKLEGMDINFDGWDDLAFTENIDSVNKTLTFFMISKNESYKLIPGGIGLHSVKLLTEEKILLTQNYSKKDPMKIQLKYFKWMNDSLRLVAQSFSNPTHGSLDVTICINNVCDTKGFNPDSLKGKDWEIMVEKLSNYPPEW